MPLLHDSAGAPFPFDADDGDPLRIELCGARCPTDLATLREQVLKGLSTMQREVVAVRSAYVAFVADRKRKPAKRNVGSIEDLQRACVSYENEAGVASSCFLEAVPSLIRRELPFLWAEREKLWIRFDDPKNRNDPPTTPNHECFRWFVNVNQKNVLRYSPIWPEHKRMIANARRAFAQFEKNGRVDFAVPFEDAKRHVLAVIDWHDVTPSRRVQEVPLARRPFLAMSARVRSGNGARADQIATRIRHGVPFADDPYLRDGEPAIDEIQIRDALIELREHDKLIKLVKRPGSSIQGDTGKILCWVRTRETAAAEARPRSASRRKSGAGRRPDKNGNIVRVIISSGDLDRYGRRWKEILGRYSDQLPKAWTPDQLRKRVERQEQADKRKLSSSK